ncbi:MAG: 4-(cytidine 5'-diphospho)-2-C-methyl-D-erythritol kinase [Oleispira sp.]|nr:4-(cytidine 5'-diphospho)-2-C-methyl-D-erythritol kinase [Oleispira sp.]MBL4881028.1 4-(cytidine 5'-diphospho)-2-C-methyl-D-erythritol kinase [Oleispira sp.]
MLHITGRRADGYHELQTIFQFLDHGDQLSFQPRDDSELTLIPEITGVNFEDNLIIKAARSLQQHKQMKGSNCGANIKLEKILPMGGGLGGGSSDAATTMLALNKLWQLNLTLDELAEIGVKLGADVPVFIKGQACWAEGVGEKITPLPDLVQNWFLVACPNAHSDTKEIFSHKELTRDSEILNMRHALEGQAANNSRNDCQLVASKLSPEIGKTLNLLNKFGSAKMTGTGACVFLSFASENKATKVASKLPAELITFIAKGTNLSSAHKVLFGSV